MWGNFFREVPPHPFKNFNEKKKTLALATTSILVRGRTSLFQTIAAARSGDPSPIFSIKLDAVEWGLAPAARKATALPKQGLSYRICQN